MLSTEIVDKKLSALQYQVHLNINSNESDDNALAGSNEPD